METAVSAQTPKAPDFSVEAAAEGGLQAKVTFTMPTESLDGTALRPNDPIDAHIWSEAQELVLSQLPGTDVDVWLNTVQGPNTIYVRVDSDEEGVPVSKDIYTGVYKPNRVHDLTGSTSPDNLSMTLTWTPPTSAKDNGYFDPSLVTYGAYTYTEGSGYQLIDEIGTSLTYTFTLLPTDPQAAHTIYIFPSNAAGMSDDTTSWTYEDPVRFTAVLGTPYQLPLREDFTDLQVTYTPMRNERPDGYAGRVILQDPSGWLECSDGSALFVYNPLTQDDTMARASTPKISTKGVHNAALTICALSMPGYTAPIYIYALRHETEPELIYTISNSNIGSAQWVEHVIPLSEDFQNRDWIQFYFDFDLPDVDYVGAIDWYSVSHTANHDLALTAAETELGYPVGLEGQIKATVFNPGMTPAKPKVRMDILSGNNILRTATYEAAADLPSGGNTEMSFSFTPDTDWFGLPVNATLTLIGGDDVAENDSKTVVLDILRAEEPVVFDLEARSGDGKVHLSWSEPMTSRMTTQGFESAAPWSFAENIEGFANIDVDGQSVYRFNANSMPNENTPKAFMVALPSEMQDPTGLDTHSGDKYLMVTCPEQLTETQQPDPADDWLISPKTEGGIRFSFWVNIISERYPETFEVYASSTGRTPADFTDRMDTFTKGRHGWEKMEYILPEDAEYFAIRYVSRNMFGGFIDDIRFADSTDPIQIERYEIFRDGELIGTSASRNYEDSAVAAGETHTYRVRTIAAGEHPLGNSAEITVSGDGSAVGEISSHITVSALKGAIEIDGASGISTTILNPAGVIVWKGTVPSDSFRIPMQEGIYLVALPGTTRKVAVR